MELNRIDNDRNLRKDVKTISVCTKTHRNFTITEDCDGELRVHAHRDRIIVIPACGNEVLINSCDSADLRELP